MENIEDKIRRIVLVGGFIIASTVLSKLHAQTKEQVNKAAQIEMVENLESEYTQEECDSLENALVKRKTALWIRFQNIDRNPFPKISKGEVGDKEIKRLNDLFVAYLNIGILNLNRNEHSLKEIFLYLMEKERIIKNTEMLFDAFEGDYIK